MDIKEIIRRWQDKQKISEISRSTGIDRKTIRKYISRYKVFGNIQPEDIGSPGKVEDIFNKVQINRSPRKKKQDKLLGYDEEIRHLLIDEKLQMKTAYEILSLKDDLKGALSISTFYRYVEGSGIIAVKKQITCRIEVEPGKEVQIDYGLVGTIIDPRDNIRKKVYAFIATLSHSRHKYVEFVYSQDQMSFIGSHVRMFKYFSGVTERILIDNLKSGVIKPDLYDPRLNRSYQEMAEHYGCFIDPCRVRHPKDKGKVERDVQTIREQFKKMLVLYPEIDLQQANNFIQTYLKEEYGQREHGTTRMKPYKVFTEIEQPAMKRLPENEFIIAQWKKVTVHPDCYIQFNKKSYSVPFSYVGKNLWVKGTEKIIQIYYDDKLIKQHTVSYNYRNTDFNDFPENFNHVINTGIHKYLIDKAKETGENFHKLILKILNTHLYINLRKAQGLIGLSQKYDSLFIEQASQIALSHSLHITPKSFKMIIEKLVEQTENEQTVITFSEESLSFIRNADYFSQNNLEN